MNNLKSRRAFIVGLSSTKITNKERLFLRKYKPWGIILFARNIIKKEESLKKKEGWNAYKQNSGCLFPKIYGHILPLYYKKKI